ncbi:MAG: hypothetical protein ACT4QE_17680 [Anaerolineales bacterium]
MDSDLRDALPVLIGTTLFLCCCCLVLIGGGAGAFFFFRNRQKSAEVDATSLPSMTASSMESTLSATPSPFAMSGEPAPFVSAVPPEPAVPAEPAVLENLPGPATPIDADDIRAKVLALNTPEKSYVVQATGYKLVVAPTAITGYLLEVAFDYVERVARFVETNAYAADASLKSDVRGVLEASGWTIRESSSG